MHLQFFNCSVTALHITIPVTKPISYLIKYYGITASWVKTNQSTTNDTYGTHIHGLYNYLLSPGPLLLPPAPHPLLHQPLVAVSCNTHPLLHLLHTFGYALQLQLMTLMINIFWNKRLQSRKIIPLLIHLMPSSTC